MPEPVLPPSFEWVSQSWGRTLRCVPLAPVAPHAFTTRQLPLPPAGSAVADGWADLAVAFGVEVGRIAQLTQVHGARVVRVPHEAPGPLAGGTWGEGDALTTDAADVVLAVKAADCVPVLLADQRTGAVAAVHAGWRGTAVAVVQAAVGAMSEAFGTRAADLVAAIGPSIGPCCYEVGTDVCDTFLEAGAQPDQLSEWFSVEPQAAQRDGLGLGAAMRAGGRGGRPGKLWLNTWQANADLLVAAGVPRDRVHISGLCTGCYPDVFHSYRVDGAAAGRMAGVIRKRPSPIRQSQYLAASS